MPPTGGGDKHGVLPRDVVLGETGGRRVGFLSPPLPACARQTAGRVATQIGRPSVPKLISNFSERSCRSSK